ncbi:MAG: PAS domain S-box protein [Ktedonobacteraceae bacterium]
MQRSNNQQIQHSGVPLASQHGQQETPERLQFLANILQNVRDSIVVTDLAGKIIYWNEGAREVFGYTAEEMLGQTPAVLYPDVDMAQFAQDLATIAEGTDFIGEWRGQRKDGSRVWVDIKTTPLHDTAGAAIGFMGLAKDIGERKHAEEERHQLWLREQAALKEAEQAHKEAEAERQRLQQLLMQAPAGIAILRGPTHIYEMTNALYQQIVGRPASELIGKPGRTAVPELVSQGIWDIFDRIYATGEPFIGNEFPAALDTNGDERLEQKYFNFVGQPIHDVQGRREGILIHAVDVSGQVEARRDAEELARQLGSERELLALAQEAGRIGTFEWNIQTGNISWTQELEALYGLPPGGFEGRLEDWLQLLHPEDREQSVLKTQQATTVSGEVNTEFRIIWPDHSSRWIAARARVFRDEQGQPLRMVGINMDISEHKALEQRKDEFISMASHELKTPVTSIKGFTQVLQRRLNERNDEQVRRFLARMDKQLNKLTQLINDLLDISRMETGKLFFREEPFELDEVLHEVLESLQEIAQDHQLSLEGNTQAQVFGDKDRIEQVLINLLTNAIKYSPQANKVVIRTSIADGRVVVSIQDFGIGIAEVHQQHIFERFYQVSDPMEKTFPGLGIGLYISNEIIRRHHGKIWVESHKGEGATFSFSLPLSRQQGATGSPDAANI